MIQLLSIVTLSIVIGIVAAVILLKWYNPN